MDDEFPVAVGMAQLLEEYMEPVFQPEIGGHDAFQGSILLIDFDLNPVALQVDLQCPGSELRVLCLLLFCHGYETSVD